MKIFLSYRRDDTGGRAGRLFDVLVARFGARNVFQDVTTVAPGRDFAAQVDAAVTESDAVLVVIGPSWLGTTDQGGRRIDLPDDFVRREVSMALATEIPVVPVLVGGASLPLAEELPEELATLRLRQAVTLRDASWHQDVDDLVRRLEGEQPIGTTRRRWPLFAAAGVAVVIGAVVVAVLARDGDDGESSDQPPPCQTDDTWTPIELADDPTHVVTDELETIEFEAVGAVYQLDGSGGADVVLEVVGTNHSEPQPDVTYDGGVHYGLGWIRGIVVDGIVQSDVRCWGPIVGDPQLQPTQRAIATMGFHSEIDPTGKALALQLSDFGGLDIGVAS